MYTVISLRSRSRVRLRVLHQWLGRDGTCGGRLWVDDENISSQFLISYSPKTQTWRRIKRSRKKTKQFHTFNHSHPAPETSQSNEEHYLCCAVAISNHSYHGNWQFRHTVRWARHTRQKTWNSLASLSNKWWPCWTENSELAAFMLFVCKF